MIPGGPLVYIFVSPVWRLVDLVLFALLVTLGFATTLPFLLVSVAQHGGKAFGYERLFATLSKAPLGAGSAAFGFLISLVSPYSGPVDARFQTITPTGCTATISERPWLHNPFRSLHAVALANLGELTGAIAVLNACGKVGYRGIVTKLTTRYVKKARGVITAKVVVSLPSTPGEFLVSTEMTDESGDIVAITETAWTLAQARAGKKQT